MSELPQQFQDLERYIAAGWAKPTKMERWHKRLSCEMPEIQEFYDTMLACLDEVVGHVNQYPLDAVPENEQPLLNLALSFMDIAPAVEIFGAPDVTGCSYDHRRMTVIENGVDELVW